MDDLNKFICSNPIILGVLIELIKNGVIKSLSFLVKRYRLYKKNLYFDNKLLCSGI